MNAIPADLRAMVHGHIGPARPLRFWRQVHTNVDIWELASTEGDRYFLKRFRESGSRSFEQEQYAYRVWTPQLRPFTPVLIASQRSPIATWQRGLLRRIATRAMQWTDHGSDALLISAAPGAPFAEAGLTREQEQEVHRQAGCFLRRLHELSCAPGTHRLNEAIRQRAKRWARRASGRVQEDVIARVLASIQSADFDGLSHVAAHRDFSPDNWLVDAGGEQPTLYVVDFGDSRSDVWLVDLLRLWTGAWIHRLDLMEKFFDGYGRRLTSKEEQQLYALLALDNLARLTWSIVHNHATSERQLREVMEKL